MNLCMNILKYVRNLENTAYVTNNKQNLDHADITNDYEAQLVGEMRVLELA